MTELTANDSFLTSLIGSSTTAYGGNAMGMTTGLPASPNGSNGVASESDLTNYPSIVRLSSCLVAIIGGRGEPSWSLIAVVLLACLYATAL